MQSKSKILIVVFSVFGISCAAALFLCYLYTSNTWTKIYCHNPSCKRSAENLLSSMNKSVDPCDDFYEFACGNFYRHHPVANYKTDTDWFDIGSDLLFNNISEYLRRNDSEDEPKSVHQARSLYRSCINLIEVQSEDFRPIAKILEEVHLPVKPPMIEESKNFSLVHTIALSKLTFNKDFFIAFSLSMDPKNLTRYRLSLSKPTEEPALPVHYDEKRLHLKTKHLVIQEDTGIDSEESEYEEVEDEYVNDVHSNANSSRIYEEAFHEYALNVTEYVYDYLGMKWTLETDEAFNETVKQLIQFDILMTQLSTTYFKNDSDTPIPVHMRVDELQEMTDQLTDENSDSIIDWKQFFQLMFRNTNITLDFEDADAEIVIKDKVHIFTVLNALAKTPPRVIEFYLWWTTVTTIAPYTPTDLRAYTAEFLNILKETEAKPRHLYCAEVVNTLLGMATAYPLVNDTSTKENMQKVSQMVENIQTTFRHNIKNLDWMDQRTKLATTEKLRKMKTCIGYPPWLKISSEVDKYYAAYENIDIANNDFLTNVLNLTQIKYQDWMESYRDEINIEEEMWVFNPIDVNAYNWLEGNRITIPAGILQFPFYDQGLQVLNYGAIGSIIGHELTHGFDNTGKEYDHTGIANPWWTNETMAEFNKRMRCFIDHYNNFQVFKENQLERNTSKVENADLAMTEGLRTLDENIADNGGLRNAYYAYKNYVRQHGTEPLLPALKDYSAEHLFFLSFANTWCENKNEDGDYSRETDEHSPNRVRVWGTLTNSKEFASTWKCKQGTPMNPKKEKCEMW